VINLSGTSTHVNFFVNPKIKVNTYLHVVDDEMEKKILSLFMFAYCVYACSVTSTRVSDKVVQLFERVLLSSTLSCDNYHTVTAKIGTKGESFSLKMSNVKSDVWSAELETFAVGQYTFLAIDVNNETFSLEHFSEELRLFYVVDPVRNKRSYEFLTPYSLTRLEILLLTLSIPLRIPSMLHLPPRGEFTPTLLI
jgi:hypothetical protein